MRNYLAAFFRFWLVFGYYVFVCPVLFLILLVIHPFKKNREVTYKNVFDSDFISTDPEEIKDLRKGQQYYSYKSAWDFLIDNKTYYTK